MTTLQVDHSVDFANPLDILEAMFQANEWPFERSDDEEIIVETTGGWCDYRMLFVWREDMHAFYYTCTFDLKIPGERRASVAQLLALINEKMWMGHFDLCSENGAPTYRHTLPTRGMSGFSVEQLEDLMDIALAECERFYPAFQLVCWADRAPGEALQVAMSEAYGRA
jgi:hypothetical protein